MALLNKYAPFDCVLFKFSIYYLPSLNRKNVISLVLCVLSSKNELASSDPRQLKLQMSKSMNNLHVWVSLRDCFVFDVFSSKNIFRWSAVGIAGWRVFDSDNKVSNTLWDFFRFKLSLAVWLAILLRVLKHYGGNLFFGALPLLQCLGCWCFKLCVFEMLMM